MLKKLDVSDNNLEDEGLIYLSVSLKSCSFLETLVNNLFLIPLMSYLIILKRL